MNRFSIKIRNISLLLAGLFIIYCPSFGQAVSASIEKIIYNDVSSDSTVSVVIFIDNENGAISAKSASAMPNQTLQGRHKMVIDALRSNNSIATARIKSEILKIAPSAIIREFWIAPVISVDVAASKLKAIADLPDVAGIYENGQLEAIEPVEIGYGAAKVSSGVSSHIAALNIPELWARGLTGKGRLVCNFDTGVESWHPALGSKWRGNIAPFASSFFAPSSTTGLTFDKTGHGTHTMGLMVGNNEIDSFGVAPDAQWIAAAVVDQGLPLSQTFAEIIAAYQWAIDPDGNPNTISDMPDVILNSWGVPTSIMDACDETFYQVIDNAEAAGIVAIFAAGNEGPDAQTLRIPANRASSPYNSFSVGAIDASTNIIASFSSRGPSSCDTTQKKPEVVAPGIGIYSSYKDNTYIYKNGTSMAAPLIAGLVPLLRQYNPDATVNEIKYAIIMSCRDLGAAGEDNVYGYGLPDALAALGYMPPPVIGEFEIVSQVISGDGVAELGETFELHLNLRKPNIALDSVRAILSTSVSGVNINQASSSFIFGNKSNESISSNPFNITFDHTLQNGQLVSMDLKITDFKGVAYDTLTVNLLVGVQLAGNMKTHATSRLAFTVTDFGQNGLGKFSIFNAGGAGLQFENSGNLLYESGIIVGRSTLQLSSSIRDSLGNIFNTDFTPDETIQSSFGVDYSEISTARYSDHSSTMAIPIAISQEVQSFDKLGDDNYMIIKYHLVNVNLSPLTGLYFGFFNDLDILRYGDQIGYLPESEICYQYGNGYYVGLISLTAEGTFKSVLNGTSKTNFTDTQKFALISSSGTSINTMDIGDHQSVVKFGPMSINARDSVEVALAIIVADNLEELETAALRARISFGSVLDVAD
ncbi:MAG: S8 family serine peptidase, partial [Candidatus Zixiibacteriota bacterium]